MESTLAEKPLLEVKDFSLSFRRYEKGLRETRLDVIRQLNMTIHIGEVVAVVGASGSGKSILANAILGILPENVLLDGSLKYRGETLTPKKQQQLRGKKISLIPQSVNALNPLMKTGKQVQSVILSGDRKLIQQTIFEKVGLPAETGNKYPFELSGGMARRVMAATAMVSGADLIIADEPTPGLDPKVLQETVDNLQQLALDGKGIMFITHDIDTALKFADRVVVFREGKTVEIANVEAFKGKGERLNHSYTKQLWNALPQNQFIKDFNVANVLPTPVVSPQKMLDVKGISFHYGKESHLFKDLDLTVAAGEIVGLHGYSGSGKSTMAQIIAGYLKSETGLVTVDGKSDLDSKIQPVQLIWQHPEKAINPRWRMKKVLAESGMSDSGLLEELNIRQEWLSRWPSELSGGELQRFCVARALNENTKYLIADEMTTMLDTITQAHLWKTILRLAAKRGIGVLAISHDYQLLKQVSNRIINFNEITNV
ncbi:ABC transporter ATP-binding protein [Oceanobacillus saliphilus]|uniref:ABC transporter ATP-binding protein n=1 Tax=Oceanobacillus saliphilus TaxID=2925834 RepID=UPI00201E0410|nr:ATP-binding cassette domain-containing protein [Oceanobacillus saliphilus]